MEKVLADISNSLKGVVGIMSILDKFKLDNKVAIVTGAAQGLGKSIAIGLAEAGADIVIVDINYQLAQKTAQEIGKIGGRTLAYQADVTNEDQLTDMLEDVLGQFDRIDILVNNAGICKHIAAEKMDVKDWQNVLDVNLTGVFLCSKVVALYMLENKQEGSIINMASMSGYIVNYPQAQSSYNASKAGVIQLTKSLAAEWAEAGIRVNAIAPGYMKTEMTKKVIQSKPETTQKYWVDPAPMKRMGRPEELQGAAIYLASEASSFMTGNTMIIDGGYTIY